ncbi:hypothetical protein D3C85_1616010 [compost metagenome]
MLCSSTSTPTAFSFCCTYSEMASCALLPLCTMNLSFRLLTPADCSSSLALAVSLSKVGTSFVKYSASGVRKDLAGSAYSLEV